MARAATVATTCPCCAAHIHRMEQVYTYARAYLCELHRKVWDAANANVHRAGICPHFPKACPRCGTSAHRHDYSDGDVCNGCDMLMAAR